MQRITMNLTQALGYDPVTRLRCEADLTETEANVALLLIVDFDLSEIADKMMVSYKTVRTHVHNIRVKLRAKGSGRGRLRREISSVLVREEWKKDDPFAIVVSLN